jgi:hypothetical protein
VLIGWDYMELKKIDSFIPEFWEGNQNVLIRIWTYIKVGLDQVNNFKYVAAFIFGIYLTLKFSNYLWLAGMFLISVPILALLGHWWLYKGSRTSEYVMNTKGTVVGYQNYNAQIETIELLKKILKKLNGRNSM